MATPPARALTADDASRIAGQVTEGVSGILGFTNDMFNDRAGFIAGDGGNWPLAEAVRAVSRFNCRRWGAADKSNFSTRVNTGNAALCNRYLGQIGELPPDGNVVPGGGKGKCSTLYRVEIPAGSGALRREFNCTTGALVSSGFTGTTRSVGSIPGPIQRIFAKPVSFGSCGPSEIALVVVGNDGLERLGGTLVSVTTSRRCECDIVNPIIERQDGLPDNCADAGGEIVPPGRPTPVPTPPPNIKINIPGVGPITVTVTPNAQGDPVVCYTEIDLCVTIPIGGGDGAGDGAIAPGDQGIPGDTTAPSDEEQEGEDPEKNLVGVLVQLVSTPARANTVFNSSQVIYKGSCFVYFGGEGGYAMQQEAQFCTTSQFFYAPEGCNKWRVVPNPFYTLSVTPFYKEN